MHNDPVFCRGMLYGLLDGCPLVDELDQCQLRNVRRMGRVEQIAWVHTLSDRQCMEIFHRHLHCMNLRELD